MRRAIEAVTAAAGPDATPEQIEAMSADQIRAALADVEVPAGVGAEMLRRCAATGVRTRLRGKAVAAVRSMVAGELERLAANDAEAVEAVSRSFPVTMDRGMSAELLTAIGITGV